MLAHSPPLPLVIDYFHKHWDITAEDEEGITLALELRDRVRRVRLLMPVPKLQKLIMTINEEYPVLEYLIMEPPIEDTSSALILPETLQAPHLRHFSLINFVLPIGSRLLTTAVGLVTLALYMGPPSTYFQPNALLHWISSMPQLEMLTIFLLPVPNRDVERQLMHMPITADVTLPNLRHFVFQGVSAYMEAVIRRITTPCLEELAIQFFNQLTFSIPHLLQFVNTTENFRFDSARFRFFREKVYAWVYHREVSSVTQIFNSRSQISSTVEHLNLEHSAHSQSFEEHNEVDRTEWRNFLRSFSNVKTLRVEDGLVEELSRSLRLDDGELPLELLPELQELTYSGSGDTGDAFKSFIDARQNAGRPVTLIRSS
jgi:hypothetical protein